MQYIFLDTNIFIHFNDFEKIDWVDITKATEPIEIVIAPVVLEELDKHKYNKNSKISQRVKRLLPKLEKIINREIACKYSVSFCNKNPDDSIYNLNNLDKSVQDDKLLAFIIAFKQGLDTTNKALLITHDVGPRLKAKSLQIEAKPMDEKYLLSNEPDEMEIQNRALQREIHELKNRAPKVGLYFKDKSIYKPFHRVKLDYSREDFVENELGKAIEQLPYLSLNNTDNSSPKEPFFALSGHPLFALSPNDIHEYNQNLENYFEELKAYLADVYSEKYFWANSIKIELLLENSGTAPASDIDIDLHFPDGFELLTESDFPKRKSKPKPPLRPKNRLEKMSIRPMPLPGFKVSGSNVSISEMPKLNQPNIKKTSSYNVNYHVASLKHHQYLELEPLYAVYDDIMAARGFQIDYKLIISDLPKPVEGVLNVSFEQ